MKISFVVSSLRSGGAERVITLIANEMAVRGHQVSIHTFADADETPFYKLGASVELRNCGGEVASENMGAAILANLKRKRLLAASLRVTLPDVIVSFMTSNNVLALLARPKGVPVVVSERLVPWSYPESKIWSILRRVTYNRAAAIVTQSARVNEWAQARWKSPIHKTIPNPVLEPVEGHVDRENVILSVGRMTTEKGHERLIRAFANLSNRFPDWKLRLIGDGPLRESLEALVEHLNIADRVMFVGRVEDTGPEFRRARVFALPSFTEGFPNALLEAMAHGCACVSFDCPVGPSEMITNEKNGLLVPGDSWENFAEALGSLMENCAKCEQIGKEAEQVVERFSIRLVGTEWENVLDKVRSIEKMRGSSVP